MLPDKIHNIETVKQFFEHLVKSEKLNFHPDTDFTDYVNIETGKQTYSANTAKHYNSLMDDAFAVCENASVDIYELAIGLLTNRK